MSRAAVDSPAPAPSPPACLLYGATVLTLDEGAPDAQNVEILIQSGRVTAIGRALTGPPGTRMVDVRDHLVLPGLVQGHIHLGQTFFRGLAEGRRLLPWLRERIWPLEAAHDEESAYWCGLLGAAECLLSGTTTIQDIGLGPGITGLLRAIEESGLRAIAGKCLMDAGDGLPAALAEDTDRTLAESEELGRHFTGPRHQWVLNPRFILTCSDALWRGIRELAEKHDWPVHTHALEQRDEVEAVRKLKAGRDEIEYFADEGLLAGDLRIAHGVWLDEKHYGRLARERFSVVHCPSANLKLGSGIADVVGLRRAGIPVGVGADGAGCNNALDAFEEMRLAALLQQLKNGPGSFSGRDALALATREGARAIGLGEVTGKIAVGMRADLVVLATARPELWAAPGVDPHDLVAWSAGRAQVRHVFVDGEMLVEDGRLTRLDLEEIRREATRTCGELVARSGLDLP